MQKSNTYIRFTDKILRDFQISDFETEFNLEDIKNLNEAKTSGTIPITIPITSATTEIFGHIDNITNISTKTRERIDCQLIQDNRILLNGYLYIDAINEDSLDIILVDNDLTIFEDIGDKILNELNFTGSTFNFTGKRLIDQHAYNQNTWNYASDDLLNFVLIDWQKKGEQIVGAYKTDRYGRLNRLLTNCRLTPIIKIQTVFDKVIQEAGYTYSGSSAFMQKLAKMRMTTDVPESNYTTQGITQYFFENTVSGGSTLKYFTGGTIPNAIVHQSVIKNYTKVNNYVAKVNTYNGLAWFCLYFEDNTEYTLTINIYAKGSGFPSTGTTKFSLVRVNQASSYVADGQELQFPEIQITGTTEALYSTTLKYTPGADDYFNDHYILKIEKSSNVTLYNYQQSVGKEDCGLTIVNPTYLYHTGNTFTMNDLMSSNYKQRDFLNDVLSKFNIFVKADRLNKKLLHFDTRTDFYNDEVLDWSDKIDLKNHRKEDYSKLLSGKYILGYAEGSDEISQQFKDLYFKQLNSKNLVNPNLNSQNETQVIQTTDEQGVFADKFISQSSTSLVTTQQVFRKPILTHYSQPNGAIIMGFINKFSSSVRSGIAYMIHPDYVYNSNVEALLGLTNSYLTLSPFLLTGTSIQEIQDPNTFSLQFDTQDQYFAQTSGLTVVTNNNIYTQFWHEDIDTKLNGNQKFLTANFRLTAEDVQIDNFKKKIWIANKKIGDNYYRIHNIIFPSDTRKLSEVELVQITNYNNTPATTVGIVNHSFITTFDSQGGSSTAGGAGGTSVDLSNYYNKNEIQVISGQTIDYVFNKVNDCLETKVNTSLFNTYSGTTAPASYVHCTGDNSIVGSLSTSTYIKSPLITGSTKVCSPIVIGTTCVCSPRLFGSTFICSPVITGSTKVCSPVVCGTTCLTSPRVLATTFVCSPVVCATTCVQAQTIKTDTIESSSVDYIQGLMGSGYKIYKDGSDKYNIEIDNGIFRGELSVNTAHIIKINGSDDIMVSAGNAVAVSGLTYDSGIGKYYFTVKPEDKYNFAAGDILHAQQFNDTGFGVHNQYLRIYSADTANNRFYVSDVFNQSYTGTTTANNINNVNINSYTYQEPPIPGFYITTSNSAGQYAQTGLLNFSAGTLKYQQCLVVNNDCVTLGLYNQASSLVCNMGTFTGADNLNININIPSSGRYCFRYTYNTSSSSALLYKPNTINIWTVAQDIPDVSDYEFVQQGNTTDTDRQALIGITANQPTIAPSISIWDGVNGTTLTSSMLKFRAGQLEGVCYSAGCILAKQIGVYTNNLWIGGGKAGTWTISSAAIYKECSATSGAGMAPADYPFFAGACYACRSVAPFRINPAGCAILTAANVTGTITSSAGCIGGWCIASDAIYTGTKQTTDGFTSSTGITFAKNGGIHSCKLYINQNGNIGIRSGSATGKRIELDSTSNAIKQYNANNALLVQIDESVDNIYDMPGMIAYGAGGTICGAHSSAGMNVSASGVKVELSWNVSKGKAMLRLICLPTSATGLCSGQVWRDGCTLMITP